MWKIFGIALDTLCAVMITLAMKGKRNRRITGGMEMNITGFAKTYLKDIKCNKDWKSEKERNMSVFGESK